MTSPKRRLYATFFKNITLTLLVLFLTACGGGIETTTTDNTAPAAKPEAGSNWDQMHWDKGVWK